MPTFGERLKREREAREIDLREIAEATKIGVRYLEALEANDLANLPGRVFNKGYVRAVAEYLGADAEALVAAYDEEERARGESTADATRLVGEMSRLLVDARAERRRKARIAALAVGALIVAGGGAWAVHALVRGSARGPQADPAPTMRETEVAPATPGVAEASAPRTVIVEEPVAAAPATTRPLEPIPDTAADERTDPQPTAAAAEPTGIAIPEYGVGTGVVDRRLVGRGDRFVEGTRVWFWTRIVGASPGDVVDHVWIHDGKVVGRIALKIGGSHWRTQSRRTLARGATGPWAVEARDAAGRVLARVDFTCEPEDS